MGQCSSPVYKEDTMQVTLATMWAVSVLFFALSVVQGKEKPNRYLISAVSKTTVSGTWNNTFQARKDRPVREKRDLFDGSDGEVVEEIPGLMRDAFFTFVVAFAGQHVCNKVATGLLVTDVANACHQLVIDDARLTGIMWLQRLLNTSSTTTATTMQGLINHYFAHRNSCEVLWWVCLSVCLRGYLRDHVHNLYQIFRACCLCPWLGPPLACDGSVQCGQSVIYDCLIVLIKHYVWLKCMSYNLLISFQQLVIF